MTESNLDKALTVIAQQVLAHLSEAAKYEWENYPEVGEFDWDAVLDKVADLASFPDADDYRTAYNLLATRAERTA